MHRSTGFQHTLPDLIPETRSPRTAKRKGRQWVRPTFGEFIRQIEHEFGDSVDLSSLYMIRADRNERLAPSSVRSMCELLGIPAEDFGV